MKLRTLSLLLFLCLSTTLQAQVIATTEDGKKVVLKSDGTWMSLEDYMKSLNGEKPAVKTRSGKKAKTSSENKEEEAPVVAKEVTMDDFACGEIIASRTNRQTQEQEQALTEQLELADEGDRITFNTTLGVNSSKTYLWDFNIQGQKGCAAETPEILVTFKDGKSLKLKVATDFVCDSQVSLFLSKGLGNKNDLKALRGKPIREIAVKTRDGDIIEDLTAEQGAILQKAFNCLDGK